MLPSNAHRMIRLDFRSNAYLHYGIRVRCRLSQHSVSPQKCQFSEGERWDYTAVLNQAVENLLIGFGIGAIITWINPAGIMGLYRKAVRSWSLSGFSSWSLRFGILGTSLPVGRPRTPAVMGALLRRWAFSPRTGYWVGSRFIPPLR